MAVRRRASALLPVLIPAALALALGLWELGDRSLGGDEGVAVGVAHRPVHDLLAYADHAEPNNILYYGFLHFWEKLGSSDELLRLPSVLAFAAAVLLTGAVAWRGFGRAAGVVAALLLALNQLAVQLAQEARAFSLETAFVAGSMLAFVLVVERPGARRWALWAAASATAAYLHPFALLVVAAQAVSLAWLPPGRIKWRQAAIAAGTLAVAVIPLLVLLKTGDTSRIGWIDSPDSGGFVWHELEELTGVDWHPFLLLLYLALGLVLLATGLATRPRRSDKAWWALLPVLWLVVPVVLALLASIVQPMFLSRYLVVTVPALAVLAAGALAQFHRLPLAVPVVVALCVLQVTGLRVWYRSNGPDFRGAAAVIRAQANPGDAIITHPVGGSALAWYLGLSPGSIRRARGVDTEQERAELRAVPRVWLIQGLTNGRFDDGPRRRALGERRELRVWYPHRLRVVLFGPRP